MRQTVCDRVEIAAEMIDILLTNDNRVHAVRINLRSDATWRCNVDCAAFGDELLVHHHELPSATPLSYFSHPRGSMYRQRTRTIRILVILFVSFKVEVEEVGLAEWRCQSAGTRLQQRRDPCPRT